MENFKIQDKPGRPKKYTSEQALEARRKSLREAQKRYYYKNKEMVIARNIKRYQEKNKKKNKPNNIDAVSN